MSYLSYRIPELQITTVEQIDEIYICTRLRSLQFRSIIYDYFSETIILIWINRIHLKKVVSNLFLIVYSMPMVYTVIIFYLRI